MAARPDGARSCRRNRFARETMLYTFGLIDVDTDCRILRRGGRVVHVEPRVFDLISYLIQNRRRVVTHLELVEHVWGGCSVGESAIRHCVWAGRNAVGDSEAIRTVRPHGYQWLLMVGVATSSSASDETMFAARIEPPPPSSDGPTL